MNNDAILTILQKIRRMRFKHDLHSFKAKIKDGAVFVNADWNGDIDMDFFTYDAEWNETHECWTGSVTAAAAELARRGLDLTTVET